MALIVPSADALADSGEPLWRAADHPGRDDQFQRQLREPQGEAGEPQEQADEPQEQADEPQEQEKPVQTAAIDPLAVPAPEPVASRRELLLQLRETKARESAATGEEEEAGPLGAFTRVLDPFQRLLGAEGFRPVIGGDDHSGSGVSLGLEWTNRAVGHEYTQEALPNRVDLTLRGIGSNYGYVDLLARADFLNLVGVPLNFTLDTAYHRHPREPFFGRGIDSALEDRSSYLLRWSRAGASLWWNAPKGFRVGSDVDIIGYAQEPGGFDESPSTEALFTRQEAPGLGAEPTFVRFGGFAEFDWRDLPDYPRQGGYYAVRVHDYNDQNSVLPAHEFRRYEVEAQQYFPFLNKHRVIALRTLGVFTDADDAEKVPFFLMPTLGGSHDMRGFRTFRFRDFNKLLLQAEYRWEAWIGLDMALFADAGTVFRDRESLSLSEFQTAYGLGFRFNTEEDFLLRADLAYSSEGFKPHFSLSHVF